GCASIFLILLDLWQPSAIALMPISQSQTRSVWLDFLIWMVLSFLPAFLTGGLVASVLLKGESKQKALAPTGIAAVLIGVALATEVNSFLPSDTIKYPLIMLITPFIFFLLALREIYLNRKDPILTTMVGICIILTAIIAIKAPRWDRFLASGFSKYGAYQPGKSKPYDGRIPLYRESANGVLAVLREEQKTHLAIGGQIRLSMPDDFALKVVAAHLPFLFHRSPERALIIGDLALVIAGAVAGHSLQQIICVGQENSREIGQWFRYYNRDVGMDQRLLISAKVPHKKFDAILIDVAGGLPLLHSDLSLLSSCVLLGQSTGHLLTDDGIVAFVIPIQGINQDQLLLVISAIASIFPEKSLWLVEPSGVILLASQKPLEIDLEGLEKEFSRYEIRKSLESIGISEPLDLLGFHSSSGSEIVALKTGIPETTIENSEVLWSKYSRIEPSRVSIMRMLLSNGREKANLALSIDHRKRFVETIELAERGKHIAATRLLEDLCKENPENGYYRYCLSNYLTIIARDLRLRNQGSAARSASIMAIEMLNNNPTAYYEAALSESDSLLAVSLLDKALSLNPDYYHAYVAKARLQMTNGDPRSALETLGALMSSEPLNLEIGYLRAMALIESGQISSARMLLEQIVRRGLQSDEVMEALAYTLFVEGNLGKALDFYKILIKSKPDDLGILNNYATLLAEQGRLKKALKIWKRALKLDPNNRDIRANIEEVEAKIRGQSP
ncbi:MAG: tetratricopeptide repeat protein, partial [bacterium]